VNIVQIAMAARPAVQPTLAASFARMPNSAKVSVDTSIEAQYVPATPLYSGTANIVSPVYLTTSTDDDAVLSKGSDNAVAGTGPAHTAPASQKVNSSQQRAGNIVSATTLSTSATTLSTSTPSPIVYSSATVATAGKRRREATPQSLHSAMFAEAIDVFPGYMDTDDPLFDTGMFGDEDDMPLIKSNRGKRMSLHAKNFLVCKALEYLRSCEASTPGSDEAFTRLSDCAIHVSACARKYKLPSDCGLDIAVLAMCVSSGQKPDIYAFDPKAALACKKLEPLLRNEAVKQL
jgi:hypothetical protein